MKCPLCGGKIYTADGFSNCTEMSCVLCIAQERKQWQKLVRLIRNGRKFEHLVRISRTSPMTGTLQNNKGLWISVKQLKALIASAQEWWRRRKK